MDETEKALLSTEVIGNFSDMQKQEFAFLGGQIFAAEGFEVDDKDKVEQVREVVADCLVRGLKSLGRTWFRPDESIAKAFDAGLSQREVVVNNFKNMVDSGDLDRLFSDEEKSNLIQLQNTSSVFATDLSGHEDVLYELDRRQRVITKLHQILFIESSLSSVAAKLRDEIPEKRLGFAERIRPEVIEDRLYQNLLINLSLYPNTQPNILVEPKDVAALADIWREPNARGTARKRVSEAIKKLAQRFNLDESVVEIYTMRMLESVFSLAQPHLETEELRVTDVGIFPKKVLDIEEQEFSPSMESEVISVSQNELNKANEKFAEAYKLARAWLEETSKLEGEFDEPKAVELGNQVQEMTESLTPFELVYFLSEIDKNHEVREAFFEFEESIPLQAFVDSIRYVEAKSIKLEGTDDIPELSEERLNRLRQKIENRAIESIVSDEINLKGVIDDLPIPFIAEFISRVSLNDDQRQSLFGLDNQKWVMLCQEMGVEYRGKGGSANIDELYFPPGAEAITDYLKSMPEEKQRDIALGLRKIITF